MLTTTRKVVLTLTVMTDSQEQAATAFEDVAHRVEAVLPKRTMFPGGKPAIIVFRSVAIESP